MNHEKDMKDAICTVFMFSVIALIFCASIFFVGVSLEASAREKDAVKAGHAEYYLDKNNSRQWRWLPTNKKD